MIQPDTTRQKNRPETAQRRDAPASSQEGRGPATDRRRLGLTTDSRGVSEVLGAILMFGLLISLLVLIQVNAVPAQNQQIEFEHNQRVEQDMLGLDRAILQSGMLDVPGSSEIELAAHYPSRFFLINPSVGAGTVETMGSENLVINYAYLPRATHYWDQGDEMVFTTTGIRYRPNYKEYANAPVTIYEHNLMVNQFDNGVVVADSGGFIEGNQITLVTVEGDVSHAGSRGYVLETVPVSAPAQTVTLDNEDREEIEIKVPTSLSQSTWDEILADEMVTEGGAVESAVVNGGVLTVVLDNEQTYELRMARVGVGSSAEDASLDPSYVFAPDGLTTESIRAGETKELRVELRDEFNNRVEGTVQFEIVDDDGVKPGRFIDDENPNGVTNVETDEDGIARVIYKAESQVDADKTVTVTATLVTGEENQDFESPPDPYRITFEIPVTAGESTEDSPLPTGEESVTRINPTETVTLKLTDDGDFEFENLLPGEDYKTVQIESVRSLFYVRATGKTVDSVTLSVDEDTTVSFDDCDAGTVDVGGDWCTVDTLQTITVESGTPTVLQTDYVFSGGGTNNRGLLGISVQYSVAGDTFTESYFLQFDQGNS